MPEERKILLEQIETLLETGNQAELRTLLAEQWPSDLADIIEILDVEHCRIIFDLLPKATAAEVLERVNEATRSELFEMLDDDELVDLISELDPDDAADVLAELDTEESKEVLESMDAEDAEQIKELMVYSEDSAGGIMDTAVIAVNEDATVNEAIQKIRAAEIDEDFYTVFVVDKNNRFLGEVRLRLLITCPATTPIRTLVDTDALFVTVDADQEEIRNLFNKNELIVVPVLDRQHRLVGRITADRVIEVAQEEAAEDLLAMAGTDAAELENFSIFNAARIRMMWLLPCLAGTAVTAFMGFTFKHWFISTDMFYIFAVAILFSPMIAAISGNAGLQTSAIVVCGLATGDLAALRLGQVFIREFRVALLVALCCGVIGGAICAGLPRIFEMQNGAIETSVINQTSVVDNFVSELALPKLKLVQNLMLALAFALAMFASIMVSTTLGLFLPFVFRRIGLDPAISSGPLVTTANDSISVSIYLLLTILLTHH
jgi:magnesium transporter